MPTFNYAETGGAIKSFTAADANSALAALKTTPGADPTSGVQEVKSPIATSDVRRYTAPAVAAPSVTAAGPTADSAAADYYNNLNRTMPDEAKIKADAQAAVQGQIDNIRNVYAGLVTTANTQGEDRLGQTRSLQARSGLSGSDFGASQTDKVVKGNDATVKAINDEMNLKINTILGQVNKDAQDRIDKEKTTAEKNSKEYLTYLDSVYEKGKTALGDLAKTGITSIDQLSPTEIQDFVNHGLTPSQIKASIALNQPEKQVVQSFTSGNSMHVITKNPVTGAYDTTSIDLPFTVPQDYTHNVLKDGTVVFYPSKPDPSKPLKDQILSFNPTAGKGAGTGTPTAKLSPEQTRRVTNAGLQTAPADIQSVFAYSPQGFQKAFIDKYQKKLPANYTLDSLKADYNAYLVDTASTTAAVKKSTGRSAE